MGRAIFISYRRDDSEGEAGRLFDDLVRSFGEDSVFMDVSDISPGVDFRKAIDENVASCGVLLAIIGPAWCSIRNTAGGRRLDDPNDFVRLEIASALARKVAIIPVLVHEARMPRPEDLPEDLRELAFRNSVEITHARWNSDVQLLTHALTRYVAPTAPTDTKPVHATVGVQLPPPTAAETKPTSARPSSVPLVLGIIVAVVLALGIVAYLLFRPVPKPNPVPPSPVSAPAPVSGANALVGTWTNPVSHQNNGLDKLEIRATGPQDVSIQAWGKCGSMDCDWGSQNATFDGQQARATWQITVNRSGGAKAQRTATLTLKPAAGALLVTIDNAFSDRPANHQQFTFVQAK